MDLILYDFIYLVNWSNERAVSFLSIKFKLLLIFFSVWVYCIHLSLFLDCLSSQSTWQWHQRWQTKAPGQVAHPKLMYYTSVGKIQFVESQDRDSSPLLGSMETRREGLWWWWTGWAQVEWEHQKECQGFVPYTTKLGWENSY